VDARKLREVAGYHAGTDLVERIKSCVYSQDVQRAALLEAADRIEELEGQLKTCRDAIAAGDHCGVCDRRRLPREWKNEG
jgi:methionyl-tRNA synthetase